MSEIIKGITFYLLAYVCFAFYCLLVKITLEKFNLSVPELCYSYSIIVLPLLYLGAKGYKVDLIDIPKSS